MSMDKNSRTLKNNIIKKCFKNHFGVNFLQMSWQFIKSLGSCIKGSFLGRFCTDSVSTYDLLNI